MATKFVFPKSPKVGDRIEIVSISESKLPINIERRDEKGEIPSLCSKRIFCVFAMLDKFLGGDGLSEAKSEFWITEETDEQDVSDETLDEIIASTE
jgi:hypothetical protein